MGSERHSQETHVSQKRCKQRGSQEPGQSLFEEMQNLKESLKQMEKEQELKWQYQESKWRRNDSEWEQRIFGLEADAEILAEVPIKTLAGDIVAFVRGKTSNENPTKFHVFLHDKRIIDLANSLHVQTSSLATLCHGCHVERNEIAHTEDIHLLRIRVKKFCAFFVRYPSLEYKFKKQYTLISKFQSYDEAMGRLGWY